MIITIARTEFRLMFRDGRFRVAGVLVALLLLASLVTGWLDTVRVQRERAAARETTRRQWESQGTKNPHSAAHYSVYAFRPRPALSFVDPGIDPYVGIGVWLEAHKQNDFRYRPARDMTAAARAGRSTAAIVLQLLIPLLIVVLVAPMIVAEREAGTLSLLLALGVSRGRLLIGKCIGAVGALLVLLVPAAAAGSLTMLAHGTAEPDFWSRALLMAAGYLTYFLIFTLLGLAISAWARHSRVALLVLIGFWLANVLVPRVTADVSSRRHPLPSAIELSALVAADLQNGIDGHNPEGRRFEELKARLLQQYRVSSVDALPINLEGALLQEGEEYGSRVFDKHYRVLWSQIARQNLWHLRGAFAAPLPAVEAWSQSLAGSDWYHHQHFAEAAERYRRRLVQAMNDELTYRSTSRLYEENVRGDEFWRTLPDFHYTAPSVPEILRRQASVAAVLAAWLVASLALCAWTTRRTTT